MDSRKINYRNLSKELQEMIVGSALNDKNIAAILAAYRRKNEPITELDIADEYKLPIANTLSSLTTQLEELKNRVDNGEGAIPPEIETRISNLEKLIQTIQDGNISNEQITELSNKIDALNQVLDGTDIDDIKNNLETFKLSLTSVNDRIDQNANNIDKLSSDLNLLAMKLGQDSGQALSITKDDLSLEVLSMLEHGEQAFEKSGESTFTDEPGILFYLGKDGRLTRHIIIREMEIVRNQFDYDNLNPGDAMFYQTQDFDERAHGLYEYHKEVGEDGVPTIEVNHINFNEKPEFCNVFISDTNGKKMVGAIVERQEFVIETVPITNEVEAGKIWHIRCHGVGGKNFSPVKVLVFNEEDKIWMEAPHAITVWYDEDGALMHIQNETEETIKVLVTGV
jgi:predicted  nucleic acid-binding Zn-ribbon protein